MSAASALPGEQWYWLAGPVQTFAVDGIVACVVDVWYPFLQSFSCSVRVDNDCASWQGLEKVVCLYVLVPDVFPFSDDDVRIEVCELWLVIQRSKAGR